MQPSPCRKGPVIRNHPGGNPVAVQDKHRISGKTNLKALSEEGVCGLVADLGLPRYRAAQIIHRIYDRYAAGIDEIREFSKELRERLDSVAYISRLETVKRACSADGTEKFLFSLEDGLKIESVLIPDKDRLTLCISSQVGCAMGCSFCMTGKLGFTRNLKAFEIVDQILEVNRTVGPERHVTNVVLMGMGEPLANFDEVVEALRRIVGLLGISKRKITLSTSGLVPKIAELYKKAPDVNLAVSLNATTEASREEIMPINKRYPLKSLLEACRKFPLRPGRRLTFEYVLIDGLNDTLADARRLVRILKGIRCKINLIPLNPHEGSGLGRPAEDRVAGFQKVLTDNGLPALIRESRGRDIAAACGQLKAEYKD